ncbi:hypothetical protein GCM10017771_15140 [Streptomyces capitiformicae]|uniref:Uncharacterized protein n=1 Tax=Streptomyces capitiformicae TaxID=2014920 RepID=A0A919L5E8_9ACTN|nr:hypothetical protein GCM10017771_15140 [Streptomyces capitiformicae]
MTGRRLVSGRSSSALWWGPVLPSPIFALVGGERDAGLLCETWHNKTPRPVRGAGLYRCAAPPRGRDKPQRIRSRPRPSDIELLGAHPRSPAAANSASRTRVRTADPVPPFGV